MPTRLLLLSLLIVTLSARIQCSRLYVHPKTVYITGSKIVVSCTSTIEDQATAFDNDIEWIELKSLSIISSHPEDRVRRDGHQLLFNFTNHSDEGLYCCRTITKACTSNSIVRVVARTAHMSSENLQTTRNSDARHVLVAKSTSSGTL